MKLLIELSMESESLARAEAISAAYALGGPPVVIAESPGILIMETSAEPVSLGSRLGLSHFVSEWLGSVTEEELYGFAERVDVEGPIRVRSTKVGVQRVDLGATSRRVGGIVGRRRGVDLHSPKSDLRVVFSGKAHVGRLLHAVDRPSFEMRKNRYMPFVYPASLHPKFARALVNLTRVPPGGRLLDPFCGTGAIVAEAAISGMHAVGSDFSQKMIAGTHQNLGELRLEAELHLTDVGEIQRTVGAVDGIATDPPYGRATTTDGERIPDLYSRAFAAFSEVLQRGARAAIVVPDPGLLEHARGFELLERHELWVHGSLTRHFCVLKLV